MTIYMYMCLRGRGSNSKEFTLAMLRILHSFFTEKKLEWDGSLVLDHVLDKRKMRVITYEICACAVNENVKKTHCVGLCIIIAQFYVYVLWACYVYLLWGKNALLYYYLAEIQKPRKQSRERRIGDRKILSHCRAQCPCTDVQVSARVPIVSLNNKDSSQADARQLATAEPTYMYTHLVCSNLRSIYNTTRMQHMYFYIYIFYVLYAGIA